ncbi:MAG: nuclear transport factor 2 family protein [Anaerolineales bacterium]
MATSTSSPKTLQGKGYFIWKIPSCENGDPKRIADLAHQAQLTHVLIKIADGVNSYNIYDGEDLVPAVVRKLRELGIQIWGWHYIRGSNPLGEASKAIDRVNALQLDGYVIDAEGPYKERGKAAAAKKFMERIRQGLPHIPIALSSYRYPSYHPQIPWREFLEGCDFNMPQVYWMFSKNAGEQLARCVREFQSLTPYRPIIPTGAAFKEHGWSPDPSEVVEFFDTARELNLPGANLYSWDSCRANLPDVWKTSAGYEWFPQAKPADITEQYIEALNKHDLDQILSLYNSNAVHITAARSVQGLDEMRIWYEALLFSLLPHAEFRHTGFSGSGNSRHLTWTATSDMGKVHNGNDTFGLYKGKITYHYSHFSLSRPETN